MKSLCNLNNEAFGSIDALQDDLLFSCFQEHEAYNALINYSKFLAIGKKGAGKTAIFKMIIQQSDPEVFTVGYNLSDYPWHHHALQAKNDVPENEKFIQSWMYLMLIAIAKIIINEDQSIPYDRESNIQLEVIKAFVSDTYGTLKPEITALFTPQRKIKLSSLKAKLCQIGVELPAEVIDMPSLPLCIQEINKVLLDAVLKCIHPDHRYYICFDELDIGFETESSYYNQIIGLLRAARKFNIAAQERSKCIGVCIFLRDDIYDVLRFEDKRKLTADCVTRIEWDSERTHYTLKDLMSKRFTAVLSENGEDVFWDDVFDGKLINGKNSKYNYIDEYNKTIENGNPEKCLEELYRFSMIGNYVVGGNSGGSQKIFKYKNARNELNVDEPIIVHPGLVSALGIKEKKAKSKKEELAFA